MAAGAHGGRSLASQEDTQRGPATPPPFPEASRWPRGCRAASGHNRPPTCLPASQTRWATLPKATSRKGLHHGWPRGLKAELQSCSALGHPVAPCPHLQDSTPGRGLGHHTSLPRRGAPKAGGTALDLRLPTQVQPRTPGQSAPPLSYAQTPHFFP